MPRSKVAEHFTDGQVVEGFTDDFVPNRETFLLTDWQTSVQQKGQLSDLKALFFVTTYEGDPAHNPPVVDMTPQQTGMGRKIQVTFNDGEVIRGYTSGDSPERTAFSVFPADQRCNNERIYIVTAATEAVEFV